MAHHAGQRLLDEVRRAMRGPPGRVALALHLSRLAAPRPHHPRIARAVLNDAAARSGGQVFELPSGDLVLLAQAADGGALLSAALLRLFQVDAPLPDGLLAVWPLPAQGEGLLRHAEAWVVTPPRTPAAEPAADLGVIEALGAVVEDTRLEDLLQRQTAVLLNPAGGTRLLPLYQEVSLSVPVLEARIAAAGQATADPYLFRHLATRLDARMLDALRQDVLDRGPLTQGARGLGPALHVGLAVAGILSPRFAPFASACRAAGARVGIRVSLVDACADAEGFLRARERLHLAGFALVLEGVSHHALMLTVPAALQPHLVKLDWSPTLPEAGAALDRAVAALGPARVVLHRAETEAALGWGLARGIRRFQGRHVDAMLAAGRLNTCPHAGGCSLRQCTERAYATGPAGRAGCRDPALLDGAAVALAGTAR